MLYFGFLELYAQSPVKLPSVQNPQAAELGKYAVYPTAEYTGVLPIQIPLFDIDLKQTKIPIYLSYHTAGNKLNQMETEVGLGWSLSSFGVINRQVIGSPDEKPKGSYNIVTKSLMEIFNYGNSGTTQTDIIARRTWLRAASEGKGDDIHSDVYFYNLPSGSGKFLVTNMNTYVTVPYAAKKITRGAISPNNYNNYPFFIHDENGGLYQFDKYAYSLTSEEMQEMSGQITINSWYPSKINFSSTNEEVSINYEEFWSTEPNLYNRFTIGYEFAGRENGGTTFVNDPMYYSNGTINHKNLLITEVVFPKGRAVFNYIASPNSTVSASRFLSEILVYDKQAVLVKKVEFSYSVPAKRIKLRSVKVVDVTDQTKNAQYSFDYHSLNFPDRQGGNNYAQDFSGYYNGKSNTSLLPPFSVRGSEIGVANIGQNVTFTGGNANREPSATHMQAENIRKITYPTGGYTEFSFEPNKILKETFSHTPHVYGGMTMGAGAMIKSENVYTFTYGQTNQAPSGVYPKLNITFYPPTPISSDVAAHPQTVTVKDLTTGTTLVTKWHNANPAQPLTISEDLLLTPGRNYELRTVVYGVSVQQPAGYYTSSVRAEVNWSSRTSNLTESIFGGLRITELKSYDPGGALLLSESYRYGRQESGVSKVLFDPAVYYKNYDDQKMYNFWSPMESLIVYREDYWQRKYFGITGYSSVGLNGSPLYYEEVTKYTNSVSDSQKTKTVYRFSLNETKTMENLTYLNAQNYGSLSSLLYNPVLNEEIQYSATNKPVFRKAIGYDYFRGGVMNNPLLFESTYWIERNVSNGYAFNQSIIQDFNVTNTNWSASIQLPVNERTVEFNYLNDVLQDSIFTVKQYEYNSSYVIEPSLISETNSLSGTYRTRTYFPDDVTSQSSLTGGNLDATELQGILGLNKSNAHIVGVPVQIEHYRDNSLLSLDRTTYRLFSGKPYPYRTSRKIGIGTWTNHLEFLQYDSFGNPLELKNLGGPPIVYLWGYGGQYPVAEIRNATYSEVTNTGVSTAILNNIASTDAQRTTELNKLRSGSTLNRSRISTYLYRPLVGMSRATDASGRTTYYSYDGFGRLKDVKNTQQQVTEGYQYNYRNQ